MDVSIILVNYNTKDLTSQCIESIFKQTRDVDFEVILVDNDSKDGSKEIFQKDSRIKFIESGGNLGFGKANNLGIEQATGRYIFFLNSDTILLNNAVKILMDFYDAHNKDMHLGGIGCQLINKNGEIIHSGNYFPDWKENLEVGLLGFVDTLKHRPKRQIKDVPLLQSPFSPYKIDYVTGADLFVGKNIIDKYGAFDPDFFMYYEESEMEHRWCVHGYSNYLIDGPKIVHLVGQSVKKKSMSKEIMLARSYYLYLKKTLNKSAYITFRAIQIVHRLPRVLLLKGTRKERKEYLHLIFFGR